MKRTLATVPVVTAASAKGVKFGCDHCHQDVINYELLKDAAENYKKLQAASGMK